MAHFDERIWGEREIERMKALDQMVIPDEEWRQCGETPAWVQVTPQQLKEELARAQEAAMKLETQVHRCRVGDHEPMQLLAPTFPHVCVHCRSYYLPR